MDKQVVKEIKEQKRKEEDKKVKDVIDSLTLVEKTT